MKMRSDYMSGRCTYEEYYSEIVRDAEIDVSACYLKARVREALAKGDEHLNSIPLPVWDALASRVRSNIERSLKMHGDSYSMAGAVCVMKRALKEEVERR